MAIGWLTVLKMVPWGEVIGKAPAVAEGAKKLWKSVARKSPPSAPADADAADAGAPAALSPQAQITALERRVATLEAATSDLHEQMLASSELIKTLAEQNTQLIRRIELNRIRLLWLAAAALLLGMVLTAHVTLVG